MRKITITSFAALLSCTAYAQQPLAVPKKAAGWLAISPHTSIGATAYIAPDLPHYVSSDIGGFFQIGCDVGYMLNPNIGFFTGLQFTGRNYGISFTETPVHHTLKQTTTFTEIPLYVRVITSKMDKVGFIIDAGVTYGFLSAAKTEHKATQPFGPSLDESTTDQSGFKKTALTGFLFLGLKIPASRTVDLIPGFDYGYTFTQLSDPSETDENTATFSLKFSVSVKL